METEELRRKIRDVEWKIFLKEREISELSKEIRTLRMSLGGLKGNLARKEKDER